MINRDLKDDDTIKKSKMEKQTIYSSKPISLLEPQNYNIIILTPPDDMHLEETVYDMSLLLSNEEYPWLPLYIRQLVSRWGRWTLRGRAPSLCFEAAWYNALYNDSVGGNKFLEKHALVANEATA